MQVKGFAQALLAITLVQPLSTTLADNSTTVGGYTIHHNAFTTSMLTPEVANAYDIQRSKYRGMLNVSVVRSDNSADVTSVSARVDVQKRLFTGQGTPLSMREIKDQNAVYYIGEFPVKDEETINFVIDVTPKGTTQNVVINMEQQFFAD